MIATKKNIVIILLNLLSLWSKAQTHEYYFKNNLNEFNLSGPALTQSVYCGGALGTFTTEIINIGSSSCGISEAFRFNNGGGLVYQNSIITNNYSINIFFKHNPVLGFGRVVDFSNGLSDYGVYLIDDYFSVYPGANFYQPAPYIYYLLTMVRNGSNNSVRFYVNGNLAYIYNDNSNYLKPANSSSPIIFFKDDNVWPCENTSGTIKYLSISPVILTDIQVSAIWNNMCGNINLPIQLLYFKANCDSENNFVFEWATASEINNDAVLLRQVTMHLYGMN